MRIPKKLKFTLLGYDFLIQPSYFTKLHFTPQKSTQTDDTYEWRYYKNMDTRIQALCGDHRMIEFIFRDLDISFLTYGCDFSSILSRVMQGFSDIRIKLVNAEATKEQLNIYDNKIHEQFNLMLNSIHNNAMKDELYMPIYYEIKNYDIKNYHIIDNGDIK